MVTLVDPACRSTVVEPDAPFGAVAVTVMSWGVRSNEMAFPTESDCWSALVPSARATCITAPLTRFPSESTTLTVIVASGGGGGSSTRATFCRVVWPAITTMP